PLAPTVPARPNSRGEGAFEDRPLIAPSFPVPTSRISDLGGGTARSRRPGGRERRSAGDKPSSGRECLYEDLGERGRRAVRIRGGGTVMIGDALFPLIDWSVGGLAIARTGAPYMLGDRRTLEIELDMGDYAVNLDLAGEVVNRTADRIGWNFLAPTPTQLDVLDGLSRTATDGRLRGGPFGGTGAFGERRSRALGRSGGVTAVLGSGPIAAMLSLMANAAIAGMVMTMLVAGHHSGSAPPPAEQASVPEPPPVRADHAAVAVERLAVESNVSGTVLEWGVAPGEAVLRDEAMVSLLLEGEEGLRDVIQSPCDCTLARTLALPGAPVAPGDTVALLYRNSSEGHVHALFPFGKGPQLGDEVTVNLPSSGELYRGVVESVGRLEDPQSYIGLPPSLLDERRNAVFARIRTTPAVPAALAGDPVIVTLKPEA
ncbi:MAG: PilZ domain-containing protein, partial [Pseudomonadota bacterium]